MLSGFARRAAIVLRYLTPDAGTRRYVRRIKDSGLFDRQFYYASNPRLRRLFRLAPERHYALFGEPKGLCPNARFSPRAYLYNNPDVAEDRALLHYIESGQHARRTVIDETPAAPLDLPTPEAMQDPAPHAVVLHLFYHHLWDEFAAALRAQRFEFDLFVTATGSDAEIAGLRGAIHAAFPAAQVLAMPNHGRDIFPFVHLIGSGVLRPYAAVCKLHGKYSPHLEDGAIWRQTLVAGVLGPAEQTEGRLAAFLSDPRAGLWVADGQIYEGDEWWGVNRDRAAALAAQAGWSIDGGALRFPAGSVYWIKQAVLDEVHRLGLGPDAFEIEQALVDGTTAHAIERLMGYLTQQAGLRLCTGSDLDGG